MKLNERYFDDDGKLIVVEEHDVQDTLDQVSEMKSHGWTGWGENRHVGRVPFPVLEQWLTDAGVRFDDQDAVRGVIQGKLLSGEFDKLRPWTGTF